jgi:beta-1,4-mannosyltransferase
VAQSAALTEDLGERNRILYALRQQDGLDALTELARDDVRPAPTPLADPAWRAPRYWPSAIASPQPTLVPPTRVHRYAPTTHRGASRWPDVRHRLLVVAAMILTTGTLYAVERRLWSANPVLPGGLEEAWSWLSLLWLAPTIPSICELAGLLIYRQPRWPATDEPIPQLVCWRIVSRGINVQALTATILRCRAEMQALPLFPYVIEVITDTSHGGLPAPAADLRYIQVPSGYATPGGTRAKARALHYALQVSPLPRDAWIVHLDEESQPTPSGIRGIAAMIAEEEASGELRIGQGTITYHRELGERPFFTLADCVRTGSDLGRLFLSMRLGVPLFGLHGSFIVVRNDVEQEIGFDVGPRGSITEDAFWGYQQMERGRRCRWVDGYIEEQCTHSAGDFMKQRRRWFSGLVKVALYAPVRLRWRVMLGVSMLAWAAAPFAWLYTIEHFVHGGHISPAVQAAANFTLAVYIVTTLLGLRVNLTEHGITSPVRRAGWFTTWLACLPVLTLMESAGVAWALVNPARSFHVVKK